MRIAIVVQGRFHAFDLARALIKRGNDVTVFTNYPRWAIARFGIPGERTVTFPLHGVLARLGDWLRGKTGWHFESQLHRMFSRWAARRLRRGQWDVVHAWTGVSEDIESDPRLQASVKLVMRGSAHIRTQSDLLVAEQARVGRPLERPTPWMLAREQREYRVADLIVVLSSFAYRSFLEQGVPEAKLRLLPLGTETSAFRCVPAVMEARRARILSGAPLRVLYVGGITWQKGLFDLREIFQRGRGCFEFRVVGAVAPEATEAVSHMQDLAQFVGKKPQSELPREYEWGDIFIFTTIQDGFAVVLAQASAAALPILTTTNCCGPDLIREGETGWILPVREPGAFLSRLEWCDTHRTELAEMIDVSYNRFRTRDWADVAADFEALCRVAIADRAAKGSVVSV